MSEEDARQWPDLMGIVEQKVKPDRLRQNREIRARYWWRFAEFAPALYRSISELDRVLVISRVTEHIAFTFMNPKQVFSDSLVVVASPSPAMLAVLQSRAHEVWARFFGSSLEERFRYTPSDCFETFPLRVPEGLERVGRTYDDYRAAMMRNTQQGFTGVYGRFHDRDDQAPDIRELRDLHMAIDREVLDAYEWRDIPTDCDFFPVHDEESEGDVQASSARRKTRYRYGWRNDVRDEVLARLLELNRQRAEEERLLAVEVEKTPGKPRGKRRKKSSPEGGPSVLF